MIRKTFVMSVNSGAEAEYESRHNPIWPELERVLRDHGVRTYSISLLPATRQLFAYVEIEDQRRWDAIAGTPECKRWWRHMKDLMPHNADDSPVQTGMREIFHLG